MKRGGRPGRAASGASAGRRAMFRPMRKPLSRVLLAAALIGGVPSVSVAQSVADSIPLPEHPRPDFERAGCGPFRARLPAPVRLGSGADDDLPGL